MKDTEKEAKRKVIAEVDEFKIVEGKLIKFNKGHWEGQKIEDIRGPEEIYDSKGRKFCKNCTTHEEAIKLIMALAEEGIEAVIGSAAPIRDVNGKWIHNPNEGFYSVCKVMNKKKTHHQIKINCQKRKNSTLNN